MNYFMEASNLYTTHRPIKESFSVFAAEYVYDCNFLLPIFEYLFGNTFDTSTNTLLDEVIFKAVSMNGGV